MPRVDIPDKVTGKYTYVHNIRVPGMLHGRVVRPRGQGAVRRRNRFPKSLSVDESSIKHIPGAQVVRDGDFLGVVAPTEYDAIQAAAQLKVKWKDEPRCCRAPGNLWKQMREHDTRRQGAGARSRTNTGNVDAALSVGGEDGLADLQVPLQRAHADRPVRAPSPTSRANGATIFSNTPERATASRTADRRR